MHDRPFLTRQITCDCAKKMRFQLESGTVSNNSNQGPFQTILPRFLAASSFFLFFYFSFSFFFWKKRNSSILELKMSKSHSISIFILFFLSLYCGPTHELENMILKGYHVPIKPSLVAQWLWDGLGVSSTFIKFIRFIWFEDDSMHPDLRGLVIFVRIGVSCCWKKKKKTFFELRTTNCLNSKPLDDIGWVIKLIWKFNIIKSQIWIKHKLSYLSQS